jgi:uncharacterized protein YprB with RNaseH-like and TPR domain
MSRTFRSELLRQRLGQLSRARKGVVTETQPFEGGPAEAWQQESIEHDEGPRGSWAEHPRTPGGQGWPEAPQAERGPVGSGAERFRTRAPWPSGSGSGQLPLGSGHVHGRRSNGYEARIGVEQFLPGGEWRDEHGVVYVHERLRSEIERPRAGWGYLDAPDDEEPDLQAIQALGLERALFLDLETGGLASSPVFLAGTMHWNGTDFLLRQYFARHYGEEAALLRALMSQSRSFDALVTFNGKSYDVPFLRSRCLIHRVPITLPQVHLDLLHAARRRWRGAFEDCRLQTLERRVCRRWRTGDVPGEEVPGLYHDYVRSGDAFRLVPVFHHNLLDVVTMSEILRVLCSRSAPPERRRGHPPRAE